MTAETEIQLAPEGLYPDAVDYGGADPLVRLDQVPETEVPVSSLVPGFYLREAGTDSTHIRLLADAAGTVRLPPIIVQRNGWRIIDGMHRVGAAKLRGDHSIRARVVDCSDSEALVLAIKSNILHGLPLSRAERISGAKRILTEHRDWSDRAVAEIAGLSAKTIASLRNRSTAQERYVGKRLGRDGRRRPLSANEGRRRAAEYMSAHPDAALREVARAADVSLGTVHDVRARIRRGSDPMVGERERPRRDEPGPGAAAGPSRCLPRHPPRARAGRDSSEQLAWPTISDKLAGDPALKYTEGGRAFLRWMSAHSAQPEEWRVFIDAIPTHWAEDLSRIADTVSAEWQEFAETLRNGQVHAAGPPC